jgi:methanogenic corrinoid protein MtbC1
MSANRIAQLIEAIDTEALNAVTSALGAGEDPVELLKNGVIEGLRLIGKKFEEQEYFLAELMMGSKITEDCIALIDPHLPVAGGKPKGIVVIGAVQGDQHDLGYGLVAKQLELNGFKVYQMGVNVAAMAFIDKALEVNADIIGLSAFLVTTIPNCGDVVDYVKDMGLRDRFKVIIGGGETNQDRADKIGADGWAVNAIEAVKLCERLVAQKQTEALA